MKEEILSHINGDYDYYLKIDNIENICSSDDKVLDIFLKNKTFPKRDYLIELLQEHNNYISYKATTKLRESKNWDKIKLQLFKTFCCSELAYKIIGIADEYHFQLISYYREASDIEDQYANEGIIFSIKAILNETPVGRIANKWDIILYPDKNDSFDQKYEDSKKIELYNFTTKVRFKIPS